jgi:hypothetical protein
MFNEKPRSLVIVAALLVLLALLSTTSTLNNYFGFTRRQPGAFTANGAAGGNFQGGNNNGTGNAQGGNNNRTGGAGGNFQGRGGNNIFSLFRTSGINFQVIGYVSQGLTILGILLALLSAFGVWKQKKWGLNLGMVIALLFLIGAAPGLFTLGGRNINWLRTTITILSVLASVPVLVYGILPSVRDSVS